MNPLNRDWEKRLKKITKCSWTPDGMDNLGKITDCWVHHYEVEKFIEKELQRAREEAKTEEKQRCLEALPKKSEINYHLENGVEYRHADPEIGVSLVWERGFNHAIDQAISALSNKSNK